MTFYDRINEFRRDGESDFAFAKRLGIKVQTLQQWRGGSCPLLSTVSKVADNLGVNPQSLVFVQDQCECCHA